MQIIELFPILIFNLTALVFFALSLLRYYRIRFDNLLYFAFSSFFFLLTFSQYLIFFFLSDSIYTDLRIILAKIGLLSAVFGTMLLYYGIDMIIVIKTSFDDIVLLLLLLISGYLLSTLQFVYVEGDWILVTDVQLLVFIHLLVLIYFVTKSVLMLYFHYQTDFLDILGKYRMFSMGLILLLAGSLIAPVEFLLTGSTLHFSLSLMSIGYFMLGYYSFLNPLYLSINSFGIQYLLISDRETANPVLVFHSAEYEYQYSASLYAGWLKGIVDVLDEITQDEQIKTIEFDKMYLLHYRNKQFNSYLFCNTDSPLLRTMLNKISDNLEVTNGQEFKFNTNEITREVLNSIMEYEMF